MAMQLFEHNKTAYGAAVRMLSERGKAAVIHPTGTGKSFIGFKLCEDNPDKTICWLSPSRYIYQTQLENLAETSDGYQPENVKFYTYAKLMNVSAEEIADIQPDYIILDEFHRCGAELWGAGVDAVLRAYPDVPVLGLSATAIRYLDNQRDMTDELFDGNVASEMTLGEAIVRGILAPPKYILSIFSYQQDLEKYEKRVRTAKSKATRDEAEKILEALRRALDKAVNLDTLFDKHMSDRNGKYIVFCANLEHMQDMMEKAKAWFKKVDKKPHIYSVYSDDPTASKSFADFKADNDEKHLKLLYCIDALNEGVHVPDVSGVILLRPTISPIIYKQQIGRALSASKSRNPVIFDIVNNIENLYSIDAIEEEMKVAIQYYRSHGGEGFVVNETFELIDKVADCKSLFDELEGTLSASWDIMFDQAKKYYDENGNIDVPKRYFTPEGYSLGVWILTQRRVYNGNINGVLTQVQIDKLNSLGMRWESAQDVAWEKYFATAEMYYKKHGDLVPPAKFVDENNVDLGRWLAQIRVYKKSGIRNSYMTDERVTALEKIGMVWDVLDYIWEEYYASAVTYHRKHGDLNVPVKYVDDNGIKLGQWLNNLRSSRNGTNRSYREMTDEQIARLDALGMIWENKYDRQWNEAFRALCEYYKNTNSFDVSVSYKTDSGIPLGKWVRRQRDFYEQRRLSDERIKKLCDIGFTLEKTDPWEEKYQLAKAYFEEHGDLNMSAQYVVNGVWLHKWLNEQKLIAEGKRKKKHTPEQLDKLEAIGLKYGVRQNNEKWNEKYELAKAYFEEHGDLDISYSYTVDDYALGKWLSNQKTYHNNSKLSAEQEEMLNAIGIQWKSKRDTKIAESFRGGFEHLEAFIAEKGLDALTNNTVCEDGYNLGSWINNCKVKYRNDKLPKKHIQHFEKLGITLDKTDIWEERYQEVKKYFEKHNTQYIPKGTVSESGYDMYSWISDQRRFYKAGKLTLEQKKKLDDIGYPFLKPKKKRSDVD
ncbi:Helicase associated domain protein [Ruminococcus albus]|uniref:Helicase domain protein n=1 Tax=Ruminococcus albus (strain ATCC 27210 / DSM 20455 / JCM 14654 / NCDO 2250 / 7) TaxID=697329 RepID=E6UK61_RUMA7|nr:Helicase associated domain protein [Ruminococcus albus]ADU24057.1 helicase domain protein [Ruminococcus albus 7 = DSM 20455]